MHIIRVCWQIFPKPFKLSIKRSLGFGKSLKARMLLGVNVNPFCDKQNDMRIVINRYYLEQFLKEFYEDIHGHCLEFSSDRYTSRFGGNKVTKIDILQKEEGNPKATIVADLTQENGIPSDTFDCIICTYTFHVVYEFRKMVSELYRILKPKGTLLVAVPCIAIRNPQYHELWRFTHEGLHLLLSDYFGTDNTVVRAYGNSLTAVGALKGLTIRDFSQKELHQHDSRYALVVCGRSVKHGPR